MSGWIDQWHSAQASNPGFAEKRGVDSSFDPFGDIEPPAFVGVDDPRAANVDPSIGQPSAGRPTADDAPLEGPCHLWCGPDHVSEQWRDHPALPWVVRYASFLMWSESGRQYGVCERVVRPGPNAIWWPEDCTLGPMVRLPGPIAGVIEIVENGERWDLSRVRRYGRYDLEMVSRQDCWPCENDRERDPYKLDVKRGPLPARPQDAEFPKLPAWAQTQLDRYGLTAPPGIGETDVCVALMARHPELGKEIAVRETRPAWAQKWLDSQGLDVVWGTCDHCRDATGSRRDATGSRRDATGARYVCTGAATATSTMTATMLSTGCCTPDVGSTACPCSAHIVSAQSVCAPPEMPVQTIKVSPDMSPALLNHMLSDPSRNIELIFESPEAEDACVAAGLTRFHKRDTPDLSALTLSARPIELKAAALTAQAAERYWGHAWLIRYLQGRVVPEHVQFLTGMLVDQLMIAQAGGDCQLPEHMTRIVRGGVTVSYNQSQKNKDAKDPASQTVFGVQAIDMWLAQVNPRKLRRRARVLRADDPRRAGSRSV